MNNIGLMIIAVVLLTMTSVHAQEVELSVCATTPDLESLAKAVGGRHVNVAVFCKGAEDPHFVEAKPSFIKALSTADVLIQVGLGLEEGWVPELIKSARNKNVQFGGRGFVDASEVIEPLEVMSGDVDRSMGDVHPYGNPHYLLDPLNGLKVAALLRDRFSELCPECKEDFSKNFSSFEEAVCKALIGEKLAKVYSAQDVQKLAELYTLGRLSDYLKEKQQDGLLGGWLGETQRLFGAKAVADHNQWMYFAKRFGVDIIGHLEPKPGIAPSTKHLAELIKLIKQEKAKVLLLGAYFDKKHGDFVKTNTDVEVAEMAHQTGSREGTGDYLSMVDYNVKQLCKGVAK